MKNRFYLACFRDNLGSNVTWHGKDGCGYVTDIDKAHVYTREEAQSEWGRGREFDIPISADHVDKLLVNKVDCQKLPSRENIIDPNESQYVVYSKGRYSGNDLFWATLLGTSVNFDKAVAFTLKEVQEERGDITYLPRALASSLTRRTFNLRDYNPRTMTQGAGIKQPEHVKRSKSRSRSSGKTMWNCPGCGKINWQHNPYDFEGCKDVSCNEWRY